MTAALDRVRAVVLDVDGVLTDGGILVDADGGELKRFHVHDGTGIKWLMRAGLPVAILSGRSSAPVDRRAAELGIEHCVQGAKEKIGPFRDLCAALGESPETVCYCGDDLLDLPPMRAAVVGACPADARPEVREEADLVLDAVGGRGAVRELAERILRARGLWADLTARYRVRESEGGKP